MWAVDAAGCNGHEPAEEVAHDGREDQARHANQNVGWLYVRHNRTRRRYRFLKPDDYEPLVKVSDPLREKLG